MGDFGKSQDAPDAKPVPGSGLPGSGVPINIPSNKMSLGNPIMSAEDFFSDKYKMDYPQRGRAVIINNRDFTSNLSLMQRKWTDQDAAALHQRFDEMKFKVEIHNNLSVKRMLEVLKEAARDDSYNSWSDCFACAILTYGEDGMVFGTDGKLEIKQLFEPFKGCNCKSLVGKPKLFFIQACQGIQSDQPDEAVDLNSADSGMPTERTIEVRKIPSEADFLIAYSVVPGYFSWINGNNGSWFVQALSEVLVQHWHDMDLMTIMTRVNNKFARHFIKEIVHQKKQIPCITSMLTKEVWFLPKDK